MILTINLTMLKSFIKKLIDNLNVEISFNFLVDEETGKVFMEISKGISDMDSESIMQGNKFSYLQGHTHFRSFSKDWKYSPPSATDYTTFLESFYRFYTKKMLIFSQDGIWEISLDYKLIFKPDGDNPAINQQLQAFQDNLMTLDGYMSNSWWDNMLSSIHEKANQYHIRLAQPPGEQVTPITITEYITFMKLLGFNVKLTPWNKVQNMIYKINISDDDYPFVNYFVKNRQNYDVDQSSFIYIDDLDDEKVYNTIYYTPEGQRVIFGSSNSNDNIFTFKRKKKGARKSKKKSTRKKKSARKSKKSVRK